MGLQPLGARGELHGWTSPDDMGGCKGSLADEDVCHNFKPLNQT